MSVNKKIIIVLLGTAQDAGVPQLGCDCAICTRALSNMSYRRLVAAIGIINPITEKSYLIDATTDLKEQMVLLGKVRSKYLPNRTGVKTKSQESKLGLEGIFLTHAHMGHYLGLLQFGKEASAAKKLPVHATSSMVDFLEANSPFKDLVNEQNIITNKITPGGKCLHENNLDITPLPVLHRHEHSDTVGYLIKGAKKQLLYIPDMDQLTEPVQKQISKADIALIDGTFYDKAELSTRRNYEDILHPTISKSMVELKLLLRNTNIYYTHFNHTNPVLDPDSEPRKMVKSAGFGIARERQTFKI